MVGYLFVFLVSSFSFVANAQIPIAPTQHNVAPIAVKSTEPLSELVEHSLSTSETGTIFPEPFHIRVPNPNLFPGKRKVLFHLHAWGEWWDAYTERSEFHQRALERGWFFFSPFGGAKKHLSSWQAQTNIMAAWNWVVENYGDQIDFDGIYAVGFSMGGGTAASLAARFPNLFAGIAVLAGSIDARFSYNLEAIDPDGFCPGQELPRYIYHFWFGADGPVFPPGDLCQMAAPYDERLFRSSVIVDDNPLDGASMHSVTETSLNVSFIKNIVHLPMWISYAQNENPGVRPMNDSLMNFLSGEGSNFHFTEVPGNHAWGAYDGDTLAIMDFLDSHQRSIPVGGKLIIDRSDKFHYFDVTQEFEFDRPAGAPLRTPDRIFTRFDWAVNLRTRTVEILLSENLLSAEVDFLELGFTPGASMRFRVSSLDATQDDFTVVNLPFSPTAVLRNGVPTSDWHYTGGTLTFDETSPTTVDWEFYF